MNGNGIWARIRTWAAVGAVLITATWYFRQAIIDRERQLSSMQAMYEKRLSRLETQCESIKDNNQALKDLLRTLRE